MLGVVGQQLMLRLFAWGSSKNYSLLRKVKPRGTTQIVTVVMLEFRGTVWEYPVRVYCRNVSMR